MRARRGGVGVVLSVVALLVGTLATVMALGAGSGSASSQVAAAGKPYDLVWISDSTGWGVASVCAGRIRQDLHVKVRVHDRWEGGLPAMEILKRLRTPRSDFTGLIPLVRDAEVIVVGAVRRGPRSSREETASRATSVRPRSGRRRGRCTSPR